MIKNLSVNAKRTKNYRNRNNILLKKNNNK